VRILVTGSHGFIGGSFGRFAGAQGHDVFGLGRRSQPDADWPGDYAQTDVAQADLSRIISDFAPDVIFHGAGSASVGGSYADPAADLRAATITLANTLEGARKSDFRPVILFPSSAAVYGNPRSLPVGEDDPIAPISPYGFHKAASELVAREYAFCFGFDIVIGRIFSVFGPALRRLLVWEIFKQIAGHDSEILLQGSGEETRDYLGIDDLCRAFLGLAGAHLDKPADGRVSAYNVASGTSTAVRALAERLCHLTTSQKAIRCLGQPRLGDPIHWLADTTKLMQTLPDFTPEALDTSLGRCVSLWQSLDNWHFESASRGR
jgi:UDP-glucose 4-epimerase